MKNILIIGAGRSTSYLFKYLLDNAQSEDWFIRVCDENQDLAKQKVKNHSRAEAVYFDIFNEEARRYFIGESDLVISMLPAHMHAIVAKECILQKTHMVTASYISSDIQSLNDEAKSKGVILMNEIGVEKISLKTTT
jgi:saccharopine dehydrogenase-like NADP-dependent oxidoreductase